MTLEKPTSIRLSADLQKKLDEEAKLENRSRSNMIIRILENHFKDKK